MSVTPGHFTLTDEQRQFKAMLEQCCPRLVSYWDFDKRECDVERLRNELGSLSQGETIMARFLAGVWLGNNALDFDMIDAVKTLDETQLQVIISWVSKPIFP